MVARVETVTVTLTEDEIEAMADGLADDMDDHAVGRTGYHLEAATARIIAARVASERDRLAGKARALRAAVPYQGGLDYQVGFGDGVDAMRDLIRALVDTP